jgi:hypothetical protein
MALVFAELQKNRDKRNELDAKRREDEARREAEREERKRQREERNAHLKEHGYVWRKEAVGTEDDVLPGSYGAGVGEFSHYEFQLYAPDGRRVSEERALAEIKFGVEWVAAEETAYAEDKARTERAEEAEYQKRETAYNEAKREARQYLQVEYVDYTLRKDFEYVASNNRGNESYGVKRGTINGVTVYEIWQTGDMDVYTFYCENPEDAGLTVKERKEESHDDDDSLGLDDTMSKYFD